MSLRNKRTELEELEKDRDFWQDLASEAILEGNKCIKDLESRAKFWKAVAKVFWHRTRINDALYEKEIDKAHILLYKISHYEGSVLSSEFGKLLNEADELAGYREYYD